MRPQGKAEQCARSMHGHAGMSAHRGLPPTLQDLAATRLRFYSDTLLYGSYNPYR